MSITTLTPIAMLILVAVIAISIGATVLGKVQTVQETLASNTSPDYNITTQGLDALGTFGDFFAVIVIVAVAAIIIGLVYMFANNARE